MRESSNGFVAARAVLAAAGAAIVLLAEGSCATVQPSGRDRETPSDRSESDGSASAFRYYFSITTDPRERRQGRVWSDQLVFDTDVMSRDFAILYQHLTGNFPKAGPHVFMDPERVALDKGYMAAHERELERDVASLIPDPQFSGIAILDYEVWRADWARTQNSPSDEGPAAQDFDFRDDWREYIRSVNPAFERMNGAEKEIYLRDTYEAATRDFYLATLRKCRELRPNARWGFYGYPERFFQNARLAPRGVISYGDGSHEASRLNDRLQWMWDAVDVVTPSIYSPRVIVEPGEQVCEDQCTAEEHWEFVRNMIRETERVANGKPVLPFLSMNYNTPHDCLRTERINDQNLFSIFMGPARFGADGAILWGGIRNRREFTEWQTMLDERVMPMMRRAVAERRAADDGGGAMDQSLGDEGS